MTPATRSHGIQTGTGWHSGLNSPHENNPAPSRQKNDRHVPDRHFGYCLFALRRRGGHSDIGTIALVYSHAVFRGNRFFVDYTCRFHYFMDVERNHLAHIQFSKPIGKSER